MNVFYRTKVRKAFGMVVASGTLLVVSGISLLPAAADAQQLPAKAAAPPVTHYVPAPAFDTAAIDPKADPCADFYKYTCGNFAANHPIPADQGDVDQFSQLYNVNAQTLNGILTRYTAPDAARTTEQQKIGDAYAACMNTTAIDKAGLKPLEPLLDEIDRVTKPGLPYFLGELQRYGVNAMFGFGELQDFKDSTKQVAYVDQGGLGLPERDYYIRTGARDKQIREQYLAHIAKMLTLLGMAPDRAAGEAKAILSFETRLAEASQTVTERRDPEAIYHPQTLPQFEASMKGVPFGPFLKAIHAPQIDGLVNANPKFFPALVEAIRDTDIETLRAYLRFQTAAAFARFLPTSFDDENFDFKSRKLKGIEQKPPRWKRCSQAVDSGLGEALGHVYVDQYFAGDSKARTLEMVHDIEAAMDRDLDTLDWMSPSTKARAKQKLAAIANKIGYPDHWRDYSRLSISPGDALGNSLRANAFENDRELAKIGTPVDKLEWSMSPPTVNAYYDPSMNNINFPAGILQPAFYDPKADLAVNYGHIGSIIGHELTHGFDDQGRKFDAGGNMLDWWTAEDTQKFEARTGCLVKQYGSFIAVDDVKVNGKLTLGENTADNGGLLLAYMAYLDRAQKSGMDTATKVDGYTGPQRFYIAYAQNWCENSRPEQVRQQVLTDPHSPDHFRADGAIVNQPGFAAAFSCKKGSPMTPVESCRVW